MNEFLVGLHNLLRWAVLIIGALAVLNAFWGWLGKRAWLERDRKLGLFFTIAIDTQLLLGAILYFVSSPWGLKAILEQGMGPVMQQDTYRFFAIEHGTFMLLAVILVHLGSALSKKASSDQAKFKRAALYFTVTFAIILLGTPWFRPLVPWF
ncbi:MAG: hypothetical protein JW862_17035 [Anaerolineales bacterium]|nr:hypothetical protein [Anaerolineales bacterium]